MIFDYKSADVPANLQSEICIVGAGPAGITLALELASLRKDVILVEGGGEYVSQESQAFYEGDLIGRDYYPLVSARLRSFGGTTGHWTGWCGPLDHYDFEKRSWIPYSGWPIRIRTLQPYYVKAQKYIGIGPFEYDIDYWADNYKELPEFNQENVVVRQLQVSKPPRHFGQYYAEQIASSKRIRLYLNANVTRLDLNESGNSIEGVQLNSTTQKSGIVAAKKYVLACGGIENPRLLLASRNVAPNGVGNDHDVVGRYFMEHIETPCARVYGAKAEFFREVWAKEARSGDHLRTVFGPSFSKQTEKNFGNGAAVISGAGQLQDGWQAFYSSARSLARGKMPKSFGVKIGAIIRDFDSFAGTLGIKIQGFKRVFTVTSMSEQVPNPDSRVVLSDRMDPLGNPLAALDWQITDLDRETIKQTMVLIGAEFNRLGIGRFRLDEWLRDGERMDWPLETRGGWHHMGTTRMADSPRDGVVDANCKVHGTDNLFIAGSSVFATGGYVNPTLTIIALAARLGEYIANNE